MKTTSQTPQNLSAAGASTQAATLPSVVSYRLLPALKRENVIVEDSFDMESAIQRAVALMELMARQDCIMTERQKDSNSGYVGVGMLSFTRDLRPRLVRDWTAANDKVRRDKQTGEAAWTAIRKLENTIEKFQAFLMMLAHDLTTFDYPLDASLGFDTAEDDLSPHLSLASDCVDYLKACFYHNFGRHLPMDEIDRKLWSELLAKFPQAEQERRAA